MEVSSSKYSESFASVSRESSSHTRGGQSKGAKTAADIQKALSTMTYKGLAMTYKSDGTGNMAHSAVIVCYDGKSRIPKIAKHYDNVTGVLGK